MPDIRYNRREFLGIGAATAAGLLFPSIPGAGFAAQLPSERRLRGYNIHTGEKLDARYWQNGRYVEEELKSINHFFRDFRTNSVIEIDVRLLDLLHNICEKVTGGHCVNLVSGYRTPKTNQMLRSVTSGVAPKSLHMAGQAADIRIPGVRTETIREIAIDIGLGGVGYYPKSNFVHVDLGHVRSW